LIQQAGSVCGDPIRVLGRFCDPQESAPLR
jgi:hypothetical protein